MSASKYTPWTRKQNIHMALHICAGWLTWYNCVSDILPIFPFLTSCSSDHRYRYILTPQIFSQEYNKHLKTDKSQIVCCRYHLYRKTSLPPNISVYSTPESTRRDIYLKTNTQIRREISCILYIPKGTHWWLLRNKPTIPESQVQC